MPPSLTLLLVSTPSPADMAFHFTLEAVLRLRQCLEDRELLRLQALLARKEALLKELESYRQLSVRLRDETSQAMLKPMPAVELHFATARLQALAGQQQLLHRQLGELETTITEQQSRYQQQRRNREVLEAIREGQLRDYRLQQRRREQSQLDELHLLLRRTVAQ